MPTPELPAVRQSLRSAFFSRFDVYGKMYLRWVGIKLVDQS